MRQAIVFFRGQRAGVLSEDAAVTARHAKLCYICRLRTCQGASLQVILFRPHQSPLKRGKLIANGL